MEVSAGWSIVRQGCERGAGLASLAQFHGGALSTHIRLDPPGMRRVDFDLCIPQFIGEMNRERIESGLGRVVRERFRVVDWRIWSGAQLGNGLLALRLIARADDNLDVFFLVLSEVECGLEAESAVSACNECNLLRHRGASPLHDRILQRWSEVHNLEVRTATRSHIFI